MSPQTRYYLVFGLVSAQNECYGRVGRVQKHVHDDIYWSCIINELCIINEVDDVIVDVYCVMVDEPRHPTRIQ